MAPLRVEAVDAFRASLDEILAQAQTIKKADTIEPPILKTDVADFLEKVRGVDYLAKNEASKKANQYAIIETAVRDVFIGLVAHHSIDSPGFVHVWNLFDIVSILSDDEQCDPALLFWLVEELLDSQTIAGCRKVFDYLESRRERIIAKHFNKKSLTMLRSCNEMLRRLSRAEDTAFCGRVFIFMFQSFPLGDKSSVNLRGEYHVENITTYEDPRAKQDGADTMDIDAAADVPQEGAATPKSTTDDSKGSNKNVSFSGKEMNLRDQAPNVDELYPVFWSLQMCFSQPKRLFAKQEFKAFRNGLDMTIKTFKTVQNEPVGRNPSRPLEGSAAASKRKRSADENDLTHIFNPKYLASRDLFELEIKDLSFRRHILVQALIIMDFLISLGAKAKERLAAMPGTNKSVMYQDQLLEDEDVKWAQKTKRTIAEYLKQGYEGPFFYRMVETVLTRDKHWVRWKIDGCPPLEKPTIASEDYLSAKMSSKRTIAKKRLQPANRAGTLDLSFLSEGEGDAGLEKFKDPARYSLPALEDFRKKIADDDFEIDMPDSEESKRAAISSKASKSWRALRVAAKSKLEVFDSVSDPDKIEVIFTKKNFEKDAKAETGGEGTEATEATENGEANGEVQGEKSSANQVIREDTEMEDNARDESVVVGS